MIIIGEKINSTPKAVRSAIESQDTEALLGKDEFCMNYLMKFREGLFEI